MIKKALLMFAIGGLVSGSAYSFEEEKLSINGKPILVVDVDNAWMSDEEKIITKKVKKIFVMAYNDITFSGWLDERLSNADMIIRSVFERKGMMVVDNPNDADIAIAINTSLSFDMKDANDAAASSILNNGASNLGSTATRIGVFGAPVALVSEILTLGHAEKNLMIAVIFKSPKVVDFKGRPALVSSTGEGAKHNRLYVKYKLGKNDKSEEATTAEVLDVLVDEWTKRYLDVATN